MAILWKKGNQPTPPSDNQAGDAAMSGPDANVADMDQAGLAVPAQTPPSTPAPQAQIPLKPGIADRIAGEARGFKIRLQPFLPSELIGGSIPHVPGLEEEAVWNAASQATGTERVHYTYTIDEGRCWYLAAPSSALASHPDSWCPLVAALPGNSEYWDRQTVYIYEQEGMASALRWDPETGRMQVFLGPSRTLLPRIQTMDANFVTISPDVARQVPWKNRRLRTEKLARATAMILLYTGLLVNFGAILFLVSQLVMTNFVQRDLARVRADTERQSSELMVQAYNALQSDTIRHMVRVQELLDGLIKIDGTLVKYEVNGRTVKWEALVPPSFQSCTGVLQGCQVKEGLEADGRVRIMGSR